MAETSKNNESAEWTGPHNMQPADQQRKDRKRVGRGHGSGMGKTSGRGHKGQGSRSGGKPGPAYEGGQTPVHMRMRKRRGPTKKTSMPLEPFRTHTQPVNVDDLERLFAAGDIVSPETLAAKGLASRKGIPVKVLGRGELSKKLDVTAAKFSAEAQRKIEAAGGSCKVIGA
ncbi:MAG: 50S ribosomal protein L15 [Thermoleophilia bacterium]|nr:50S ribosomal protein L15 [Thermoleophilia bacterium]